MPICIGHNRDGSPCTKSAIRGKTCCRQHGGGTNPVTGRGSGRPIKHGLYSKITRPRIKELLAAAGKLEDPLDLLPHVNMLGALAVDFVERYDEVSDALVAWHGSFSKEYMAARREAKEDGDDAPDPIHYGKPTQVPDLISAAALIGQIGSMVDRIHKHREKGSISMATLNSVMEAQNMAFMQAVQEVISDADLRAKVIEDADRRIGEIRIDTSGRAA